MLIYFVHVVDLFLVFYRYYFSLFFITFTFFSFFFSFLSLVSGLDPDIRQQPGSVLSVSRLCPGSLSPFPGPVPRLSSPSSSRGTSRTRSTSRGLKAPPCRRISRPIVAVTSAAAPWTWTDLTLIWSLFSHFVLRAAKCLQWSCNYLLIIRQHDPRGRNRSRGAESSRNRRIFTQ